MYNIKFQNSKKIVKLEKRLNNLPWQQVGNYAQQIVKNNFDAGGRPNKWKKRKKNYPWPILRRTDTLRNANMVEAIPGGTSVVNRTIYQAVHNFGYPKRNIPKREYLLIGKQNREHITRFLSNYLTKEL